MLLLILLALTAMYVGLITVAIRSNCSWFAMILPITSYYSRAVIAWWGIKLRIITSILNLIIIIIIWFHYYTIFWLLITNDQHTIVASFLAILVGNISNILPYVVIRALLQVWVNRWVAYQRGRSLWTGIELTFLWFIFWPILALSTKIKKPQSN